MQNDAIANRRRPVRDCVPGSAQAVGLLFAFPRDGSHGFCNPIGEIVAALQIELAL
jgi:hypothetical protein